MLPAVTTRKCMEPQLETLCARQFAIIVFPSALHLLSVVELLFFSCGRYSIMKQCWLATPEERPTFSELVTSTAPLLRTSSVYNREELETATL